MMRIPGGAKAISQGASSTQQMTNAVLAKLAERSRIHDAQSAHLEFAEIGSDI
jgi:hypothetical protein